jgi:ribosomal protein S12 methylthiotransferase
MRRPERQATIREKIRWLRDAIPDIAIRTTAIVGFPGETQDDFHILCDFAEEMQFERLGVFAYSEQDGTHAARYEDDVPDEVKRERLEQLEDVQRVISEDRLGRFVGRDTDVLIDSLVDPEATGATHVGRVQWQADDVDGVTYVAQGGWARPGEFLRARIQDNEDYDFRAEALG